MASPYISRARVALEAVRHASSADIPALRQLVATRPDALKLETVLRILLTYLPVGTEPDLYIDFLRDLPTISSQPSRHHSPHPVAGQEQELPDDKAQNQIRRLHLASLADALGRENQAADPLTKFLLCRANSINTEIGSLELVAKLLEPFIDHSGILRTWMISNLLPLLRLDYEYYPHSSSNTLADLENADADFAVQILVSEATSNHNPGDTGRIGRDLRGLVGPWMYGETSRKRRKLDQHSHPRNSVAAEHTLGAQSIKEERLENSDWSYVNEWIVDLSGRDFQKAVDVAVQWDGPGDVDYGHWGSSSQPLDQDTLQAATFNYAQACLASLYATNSSSLETMIGSHRTLFRVAMLTRHDEPPDLKRTDMPVVSNIGPSYLNTLSSSHLLRAALLLPQNPFTSPGLESISFFNLILASSYKLLNLGNAKANRDVADLALSGSEADQIAELRKTLHKLKAEKMDAALWASIRKQMLWLRDWEQHPEAPEVPRGVFSKVAKADMEVQLLRAMLEGGCYDLALETYCNSTERPLSTETVENVVLEIALSAYDAASNGNRTRGGVGKASDIFSTFHKQFPRSTSFERISALLSATHAMSFYSLTLQHGVPFRPVNIRAHKDPILLVGKILNQNPQSYTHLDDMLEIGQNLVTAGLTQQHQDQQANYTKDAIAENVSSISMRRIIRMAIEAALREDDFDTAYSYIVTRLTISNDSGLNASQESGRLIGQQDDISWRAAYEAGRFSSSREVSTTLRRLEQRMELFSQALILAPPSALSEVLNKWQECEQEANMQISREAEEDAKWDEKGDQKIPGGFATETSPATRRAREPVQGTLREEAPMGLFDVAREAATALSKNTFPLRNKARPGSQTTASNATHGRAPSISSAGSSEEGSISRAGGPARVRKRDMISSMVTGSLASGVGWVIGESLISHPCRVTNECHRGSSCQTRMSMKPLRKYCGHIDKTWRCSRAFHGLYYLLEKWTELKRYP